MGVIEGLESLGSDLLGTHRHVPRGSVYVRMSPMKRVAGHGGGTVMLQAKFQILCSTRATCTVQEMRPRVVAYCSCAYIMKQQNFRSNQVLFSYFYWSNYFRFSKLLGIKLSVTVLRLVLYFPKQYHSFI